MGTGKLPAAGITVGTQTGVYWDWVGINYAIWGGNTNWSGNPTDPHYGGYLSWAKRPTDPGDKLLANDLMTDQDFPYNNHKVTRGAATSSDGSSVKFEGGNELKNDGSVSWYSASDTKLMLPASGDWNNWGMFW